MPVRAEQAARFSMRVDKIREQGLRTTEIHLSRGKSCHLVVDGFICDIKIRRASDTGHMAAGAD